MFFGKGFHRPQDRGRQRRRHRHRADRRRQGNRHLGVGDRLGQIGADALRVGAREHPAIDIGGGTLRQCVVGMAGVDEGRDAGGAQRRMKLRVGRNDGVGRGVLRVGHQRGDRSADRWRRRLGHQPEKGARRVVELHRKFMGVDRHDGARQVGYGVVGARYAAVAAGVGRLELEILHGLFADLNPQPHWLAGGVVTPAAAFVQGIFGGDQRRLVFGQPVGTVEGVGGFLPTRQRQFQRAPGHFAGGLVPDQRVGPDRRLRLVVKGAAPVQKAVFLDHGERVARPVCTLGLDHVEMAKQQDRFRLSVAAGKNGDDAAFPGVFRRREQRDVGIGEPRRLQSRRDALGGEGAASRRQRRVGFDKRLEQLAERRLVGTQPLRRRRCRNKRGEQQGLHDHLTSLALA